jgi:prepilin-type N-terminal cleavage/methylation domain-containing protein
MRHIRSNNTQLGFSLLELMVALAIFLLITGAAFTLLSSSQQRYQNDSQLLTSFQEARLGLDQMVRDIDDAGYPPPSFIATGHPEFSSSVPFAWSRGSGYYSSSCQIGTAGGGTCSTAAGDASPGDFDLIIETNPNPQDAGSQVQWIRYQLGGPNGTTLMRGAALKQANHDPDADTASFLVPFVQNVVNNSPTLQIGQFQLSAAYSNVFQSGNPVPIFSYICDTPTAALPPPTPCPNALGDNSPANIRDVAITLIVASPLPDATTGQPRLVQLSARGHRVNPNQ